MTQEEYSQQKRECWEEFMTRPHENPQSLRRCFDYAFDRVFALGKLQASCEQVKEEISQEKDAEETVIQGWVARDANGSLNVFDEEPTMDEELELWSDGLDHFGLPYSSFPDLTWEDDPLEVKIIIKRKKK